MKSKRRGVNLVGFTLLELMVVVLVIVLMATMMVPAFSQIRGKMDRASCISNLKGLHGGASAYVLEQGTWPQIPPAQISGEAYAEAWIAALAKYDVPEEAWHCPTIRRGMGKVDMLPKQKKKWVDYYATPFGHGPTMAYRWATQPWFAERGDLHGNGNLFILCSGEVLSMKKALGVSRFRRAY